jgi:F0F1-type ATP synthase assembly protein I
MKLLPPPASLTRTTRSGDALGQGVDAALVVAVFLGIGYGLDRWLGTTPWFMIGCFLLATVGLFYTWKARYSARMDELQAQRHHDATRHRQPATTEGTMEA